MKLELTKGWFEKNLPHDNPEVGAGVPVQLKARMGIKRKRRWRRKSVAGASAPAVATHSTLLSIDDLVAAKKLVGQVGSIEKVKEALAALARLS